MLLYYTVVFWLKVIRWFTQIPFRTGRRSLPRHSWMHNGCRCCGHICNSQALCPLAASGFIYYTTCQCHWVLQLSRGSFYPGIVRAGRSHISLSTPICTIYTSLEDHRQMAAQSFGGRQGKQRRHRDMAIRRFGMHDIFFHTKN
jgi:hypothetical protein